MELIWTLLIGFVVGLLARFIKPGDDSMGIIMTTVLGIAGAFSAKFIGQMAGWYSEGETAGFLASVTGGIILLMIAGLINRRSTKN